VESEYTWKIPSNKEDLSSTNEENPIKFTWSQKKHCSRIDYETTNHSMQVEFILNVKNCTKSIGKMKALCKGMSGTDMYYEVSVFNFNKTANHLVETIYYDIDQITNNLMRGKKFTYVFLHPTSEYTHKFKCLESFKNKIINRWYSMKIKKSLFKFKRRTSYFNMFWTWLYCPFGVKFSLEKNPIFLLMFFGIVIIDLFIEVWGRKKN